MANQDINEEKKNRMIVAAAAFAYEVEDDPIMSDAEFDALAMKINRDLETGSKDLDKFFREEFCPHTGSWVWKHPHPGGLQRIAHNIRTFKPKTD